MSANTDVDILEVTLRDGSYLIDFQFTAEDTAMIGAALQAVGFRWIEVGHGAGMHASPPAAATDEEYLEAAASALDRAMWGMFFIPGLGREEDLRLAARYGMKFVRIGTNVTESDRARPFVELAKSLGMFVSYNAMKSYAVGPVEFGRIAALLRSWGCDAVALVDSAGSFDPEIVGQYIRAAREQSDVALGFHGHDNLAMAMANTLRAVEEGAVLVDASLQGMGRSAGNAITEVLAGILQQRGLVKHIDLKGTMDVGRALIGPLLGRRGVDPLAVTAGLARFHSSFMPKVQAYARKHQIDVRDLIVRLTQEDQVSAPDDLLEELSRDIAAHRMPHVVEVALPAARRPAVTAPEALAALLKGLRSLATKSSRFSVLNVVRDDRDAGEVLLSHNIESTPSHVIGVATVFSREQLDRVLLGCANATDVVLLDVDKHPGFDGFDLGAARQRLGRTLLLTYRDSDVWVSAVEAQIVRLLCEEVEGAAIAIIGAHPNASRLSTKLERRGAALIGDIGSARVVVAWLHRGDTMSAEEGNTVAEGAFLIDAGLGGISAEAADAARARGAHLLRVNMWPELAGTIVAAHESARVVNESLGWGVFADVPVVSGGALGRRGDVIVDNVRNPARVVGVADGHSGVLFDVSGDDAERVGRVREKIAQRQFSGLSFDDA